VAITHDEGDTWELSLVADTTILGAGMLPLGMDQQGNLYAAFVLLADRLPYLTISRDHGLTWSTPLMIAAPGVKEAAFVGLVAGKRGQVAVAYYGSKNAPQPFPPACRFGTFVFGCTGYEKETWDTYITESWNALEELPLFWSATLNDPAQPTFYGFAPSPISGLSTGRGNPIVEPPNGPTRASHLDYFGMTLSPDGTPWVGFFQACPFGLPVAGNPNCQDAAGGKTDGVWGMLGRLVRVGREADEHDEPDDDNH